jgi:hypothetical protein
MSAEVTPPTFKLTTPSKSIPVILSDGTQSKMTDVISWNAAKLNATIVLARGAV